MNPKRKGTIYIVRKQVFGLFWLSPPPECVHILLRVGNYCASPPPPPPCAGTMFTAPNSEETGRKYPSVTFVHRPLVLGIMTALQRLSCFFGNSATTVTQSLGACSQCTFKLLIPLLGTWQDAVNNSLSQMLYAAWLQMYCLTSSRLLLRRQVKLIGN